MDKFARLAGIAAAVLLIAVAILGLIYAALCLLALISGVLA